MSRSSVEFKFSKINCLSVALSPCDPVELLNQFIKRIGSQGVGAYSGELAVIDGSAWTSETPPPFKELVQAAHKAGLLLAGAKHFPARFEDAIESSGLLLVEDASVAGQPEVVAAVAEVPKKPVPAAASELADKAEPTTTQSGETMVIDSPVRSGQRIYAKGCDAVIMGPVNAGAEIIADGNIHVYGPLRGRALAGANGNPKARIITTSFAPELVAIAGYYLTFEDGFPGNCENTAVKIFLEDEASHLKIEPLNIR